MHVWLHARYWTSSTGEKEFSLDKRGTKLFGCLVQLEKFSGPIKPCLPLERRKKLEEHRGESSAYSQLGCSFNLFPAIPYDILHAMRHTLKILLGNC